MNKIDEMRANLSAKKSEAEALLNDGKIAEAKAKMKEVEDAVSAIEMQEALDRMEKEEAKNKVTEKKKEGQKMDSVKALAEAARHGFRNANLTEGTDANGGYTVPEDIDHQIQTFRESADSLEKLVSVENVSTLSGARTFKTRAQQTGLTAVDEGASIAAADTPTFTQITYSVKKYADKFYASNELLEDTDANITGALIDWIGNASRVGRNKIIMDKIETIGSSATTLSGIDDIKKAVNVTLDPVFRPFISIVTNQDGLQYLDTLKDKNDRYLLVPDAVNPTQYRLFGFPVVVLSNATLKTTQTGASTTLKNHIPFLIGDLKSAVRLFVRKGVSIVSSTVASDAFDKDMTVWRAIERLDCAVIDDKALVRGDLALSASAS